MASASFPSKKKDLNFFFFTGNNMNDYAGKKDLAERTIPKNGAIFYSKAIKLLVASFMNTESMHTID
ncbi:MAG: hypothetical protein IPK94_05515 [Saprospiraceae bacterium]|nr:hypothetical protein [Saprospiraceae bacterium]